MKFITLFLVCHIFLAGIVKGQENINLPDSVIIRHDSTSVIIEDTIKIKQDSINYTNIEKLSERSKLTEKIYSFLFRPLNRKPSGTPADQKEESAFHRRAQGKIIRSIRVVTLDPFGYSLHDTTAIPENVILNTGNWLHSKTNDPVIRNLLMFGEDERYDSLLVKESERLVRSQKYIRDVYLWVNRATRDSVDVILRVQDVWSTIPSFRMSSSVIGFGLKDLNFAGTGSTFEVDSRWRKGFGNVTHLSYFMPNIRNSYISVNLQAMIAPGGTLSKRVAFDNYYYAPVSYDPHYLLSENRNIIKSIEINRPFYSPYARIAGGLFSGQMITTQSYIDPTDTLRLVSARTNINDLWIGRSWRINTPVFTEGITSFVLSGRYVRVASPRRPQEAMMQNLFNTKNYLFWSMSLTSRKYYRDRYIFNYGKTEDVPAGILVGITLGKEYHDRNRFYAGMNAGWGSYLRFGYMSAHFSYGTFKGTEGIQQGILTGKITYFTKLLNLGEWKLRQFIRPEFAIGIKRSPAENQPLHIGIKGYEEIESMASNLFLISLQTQTYAPWSVAGFNFGPYFFSQLSILGQDPVNWTRSKLYSLMGFGVLIRNNYLMFNSFQVSISFYPYIPDRGYNIFRSNTYKTTDYGFRDFSPTKPGIVE
ncbi:MAG TPA: hypothetical protein VK213_11755 [Bacteroidales bacterium]|nr:hypothetical protein [Bacteroidales bacterium]